MSWLERSATRLAWAMPWTSRLFSAITAGSEPRSRRRPRKRWQSRPNRGFSSGTRWARSTRGRGCSCRAGARKRCHFFSRDLVPSGPPGRKCGFRLTSVCWAMPTRSPGDSRMRTRRSNEGLAVAEKNDDRCHEAELHRLKGELLLAESPDQLPPPKTASTGPSRRPCASRARGGSCGPP